MEAKDALVRLGEDLAALRAAGQKAVPIEALQGYLGQLETEPGTSPEDRQLELQRTLAYYDATNELNLELLRSANDAGKEALRASLLISGGAVIAILGFLGAVAGRGTANALGLALVEPLRAFGFGVLLSAVAFGARYLTTYAYGLGRSALATKFNILAILLAVSAYAAFLAGVCWAYLAFHVYFASAP